MSFLSFTLLIEGPCVAHNYRQIIFLVFLFLVSNLKASSSSLDLSLPLLPVETLWFCFPSALSIKRGQRCHSMDSFLCSPATQKLSLGRAMTPNPSANAAKTKIQRYLGDWRSSQVKSLQSACKLDKALTQIFTEYWGIALSISSSWYADLLGLFKHFSDLSTVYLRQ